MDQHQVDDRHETTNHTFDWRVFVVVALFVVAAIAAKVLAAWR